MTDIPTLTQQWKEAKAAEQSATAHRISIESQIYELTSADLPDKGTFTTETGMKITTGFTEEWDQDAIAKAYARWPVESVKFPFATTYKPDGKTISVLRDSVPKLYELLRPALTLKPKKPAFSVPSEK